MKQVAEHRECKLTGRCAVVMAWEVVGSSKHHEDQGKCEDGFHAPRSLKGHPVGHLVNAACCSMEAAGVNLHAARQHSAQVQGGQFYCCYYRGGNP